MASGRVLLAAVLATIVASFAGTAGAQTSCTYTFYVFTSSYTDFGSARDFSEYRLETQTGCPWTAELSDPFATFPNGTTVATGIGTARLYVNVSANFTPRPRTAVLRAGGASLEIRQARGIPPVDFDGNGYADLVWQHEDGRIAVWLMERTTLREGRSFTPASVDPKWRLVGAGDLNADMRPDLVWQHADDGRVAAWLMDGLQAIEGGLLSIRAVSDPEWRIEAVGDLDGDNRADLFWQHRTQGLVAVWFMDGFRVLDARLVNAPAIEDTRWRLAGVDSQFWGTQAVISLRWQHDTDGRLALWQISERADLLNGYVTAPDPPAPGIWKLRALIDADRNGGLNPIWRHETDGRMSISLGQYTPDLATVDPAWRLVGPR